MFEKPKEQCWGTMRIAGRGLLQEIHCRSLRKKWLFQIYVSEISLYLLGRELGLDWRCTTEVGFGSEVKASNHLGVAVMV